LPPWLSSAVPLVVVAWESVVVGTVLVVEVVDVTTVVVVGAVVVVVVALVVLGGTLDRNVADLGGLLLDGRAVVAGRSGS
jgi:hypothetical protein